MNQIWKVIDVINWAKDYFASKSIESPRLNIELILCKVLNVNRVNLYTSFDLPMSKSELALAKELIIRRAKGEPLQYLLGSTSFMGYEIKLSPDVLIPRPETEELIELIIKSCDREKSYSILDIGTGSGCISIALAKLLTNSKILSVDISDKAISMASENAKLNQVDNQIAFLQKDIIKDFTFDTKFDIIVSNPPYISKNEFENDLQRELSYEPSVALSDFSDGLSFYRKYAENFSSYLNENGFFALEMAYNQSKAIEEIFSEKYDTKSLKDFNNIFRFICGRQKN